MNARNIHNRTYSDLFHSMRSEGITAFYRGLLVSCIGTTIRGGVGFGVYESLKSDEILTFWPRVHCCLKLLPVAPL